MEILNQDLDGITRLIVGRHDNGNYYYRVVRLYDETVVHDIDADFFPISSNNLVPEDETEFDNLSDLIEHLKNGLPGIPGFLLEADVISQLEQ